MAKQQTKDQKRILELSAECDKRRYRISELESQVRNLEKKVEDQSGWCVRYNEAVGEIGYLRDLVNGLTKTRREDHAIGGNIFSNVPHPFGRP